MTTHFNDRKERIKHLRKQEDRKHRLPDFLNSLSIIAGRPFTNADVVSIEDTDLIWEKIHKNENLQQANLSVSFPYRHKEKLTSVFNALKNSLLGRKQYFTTSKFYETCFLHVDTAFCIENYERLIEFDGDTFYIYDENISNGLWVDTSEEHWADKEEYCWTYELRVRGVDWINKIYNAYKDVQTI